MDVYVAKIIDYYNFALDYADPRVADFPLMASPWPTLIITGVYLLLVYFGPRIMQHRKPIALRPILVPYNFILVIISAYIFNECCIPMFVYRFDFSCTPVDYTNSYIGMKAVNVGWLYFISKIVELLDTIFFILRKKNSQVTFLHVYHHSTMAVKTWLAVKFVSGGQCIFICMVNSFVHIVMYLYYGLAAIGPHMQKYLWWKKLITVVQLTQFFMVLTHTLVNLTVDCPFPKIMNYCIIFHGFVMMLLFLNFYHKAYIVRGCSSKQKRETNSIKYLQNGVNGVSNNVQNSIKDSQSYTSDAADVYRRVKNE